MKNAFSIIISAVFLFALSVILFSLVEYYDVQSFAVVGLPILFIMRFIDLSIRDRIMKAREMQTLIATFVSTLILIAVCVGAFVVYTQVLSNVDIFKAVVELLNVKPFLSYVS